MAELLALAAAAVTTVWVSRAMGAELLGVFALATTAFTLAQAVTDAGLPSLGAQIIANDPGSEKQVWRRVTVLRSVGALFGATLGVIALSWLELTAPFRALLAAGVVALGLSPLNATFALVATASIRSVALIRALAAALSTVIAVLFIRTAADTAALALLLLMPTLVNGVGSTIVILRRRRGGSTLEAAGAMPSTAREWYARAFDYAKADLSLVVYMSVDRLILFAMAGPFVVGLYEAANRLIQPFYALSVVVRESMFLELAQAIRADDGAETMARWGRLMFFVTIPVGPFLSLHGPWVIQTIYGSSFAGAGVPLLVLGWAITIGFVSGAVVLPFLAWNLGREYGRALLAGNITNLAANFLLIPGLGATGAALATVAAKVAVTASGLGSFRAATNFPIISSAGRYLALALVAGLGSGIFWIASGSELISIAAFGLAYLALLGLIDLPLVRQPRPSRRQT